MWTLAGFEFGSLEQKTSTLTTRHQHSPKVFPILAQSFLYSTAEKAVQTFVLGNQQLFTCLANVNVFNAVMQRIRQNELIQRNDVTFHPICLVSTCTTILRYQRAYDIFLYELNRCKMEVTMFARLATALTKRPKKNAQKLMQEKRSNQIFFQNDVPKTKQSSSISHFLDIFFCLKINFGNKRADSIKLFY